MGKIKTNGDDRKLTEQRTKEIAPIAKQILKIIAEAELPVGEIHAHDNIKYDTVAREVLTLLLKENIKYVDKEFLFQIVLQPIDRVREQISISLKHSLDNAIDKVLKKEFREIRLEDLDKILKLSTSN